MIKNNTLKLVALSICASACSTPSAISDKTKAPVMPEKWQNSQSLDNNNEKAKVSDEQQFWIESFSDAKLAQLVKSALVNNRKFKINQLNVELAKQRALVAGATDLPELSLNGSQSRRKSVSDNNINYGNSADISLQLNYELDIWGKLSAEQSRANLELASAKTTFEYQELTLVSQVASSWYTLIEAQQLLKLYQGRAKNLTDNLEMIQASYRLGLSKALDVYLTQNDVSRELARVSEQQKLLNKQQRQLELLLGDMPSGLIKSDIELPLIQEKISTVEPAQLLTQRTDILSSWYDMLAADAGLAIAHKQRFPRFMLTASSGDSSDELGNLLDGGSLAWSIIGNITMPLFDAGRLASLEEQAKLAVQQKEQAYLDKVFNALNEVEDAIGQRKALNERYSHFKLAQENALAAEKLSFDQYMKGLVTYTTVLESQRRAFDAQTTLIQLTNQILQNKISLHLALGGSAYQSTANLTANSDS